MSTLKTIDAETLLATPLRPVSFIVDELIPPGLHILAGIPKAGKSWLILWLGLSVAKGESVWEHNSTLCGVLYMCLEDTYNRIQNRLLEITETAPDNLYFAVAAEQIDSGLKQQIEKFVKTNPDSRLVIIDTLQRVRGADVITNAYANDYRDICELKKLADKHRLAIILVHHLRKHGDKDPFMKVFGTTGLTGGVDTTYVLEKDKRSDNTAKLYITVRDVEYMEIALQFENCVWEYLSCETAEDVRKRETPEFITRIVEFMASRSEWRGSASELLAEMRDTTIAVNTVTKLLNQYHGSILAEKVLNTDTTAPGRSRIIRLRGDGYDSCDSSLSPGKQPSQPSPTVTSGDS